MRSTPSHRWIVCPEDTNRTGTHLCTWGSFSPSRGGSIEVTLGVPRDTLLRFFPDVKRATSMDSSYVFQVQAKGNAAGSPSFPSLVSFCLMTFQYFLRFASPCVLFSVPRLVRPSSTHAMMILPFPFRCHVSLPLPIPYHVAQSHRRVPPCPSLAAPCDLFRPLQQRRRTDLTRPRRPAGEPKG